MDNKIEELANKIIGKYYNIDKIDAGDLSRMTEAIKDAYQTAMEDKWISVEKRNPEDYQEVLIYCLTREGMQILTARYCDDYDFAYTIHNYNRKMGTVKNIVITHWRPITPPIQKPTNQIK